MNELQLAFDYQALPVRTITDGMTVWFALTDVCKIFNLTNPRMVARRLDEDEVRKFNLRSLEGETWFVTESGLYTVIIRSRSEKAKPFRRWITHEVLPSIRKQGYYSLIPNEQLLNMLSDRLKDNPKLISDTRLSERNKYSFRVYEMEEQIRQLWVKRYEYDYDEYNRELARICNYSTTRYNQEWRKYVRWAVAYKKNQAEAKVLSHTEQEKVNEELHIDFSDLPRGGIKLSPLPLKDRTDEGGAVE